MEKYKETENTYNAEYIHLHSRVILPHRAALHYKLTSIEPTDEEKLLITVDRSIKLFDLNSEEMPLLFERDLGRILNGARFSCDKENILAFGNSEFCFVLASDLTQKSRVLFDGCLHCSANPFYSHLFGLSGHSQSGVMDINERKLINSCPFLPGRANCFIDKNTFVFSSKQRLYLWDTRTAQAIEIQKNPFTSLVSYSALAFNESVQLMTVAVANSLFTFDLRNKQILNVDRTLHSKEITNLTFTNDGLSVLSTSNDKSVLLSSSSLEVCANFPNKENCEKACSSISPDSSTLFTSSNAELSIWKIDLMTQTPVKSARSVNF